MGIFVNPGIDNLRRLFGCCEIDLLKFSVEVFLQGLLVLIKKVEASVNEGSVSLNHSVLHILLKNGLQSSTEQLEEVRITVLLREMEDGQEFFTGFSGATSKGKG